MGNQEIQPRGAVGQLVRHVALSVVQAVFEQDDIVTFLQENRCDVAIVLFQAGHVETTVEVDHGGILADRRVGIVDVQHLRRIAVLHVGDSETLLAGVGIEQPRYGL